MTRGSLPPGQDHDPNIAQTNRHYSGDPFYTNQNVDEGYIDTEYRTVSNPNTDLKDYIGIILRRKKTVLVVSLIVFVIGGIYTFTVDPVYQSVATLELEKETGASLSNVGDAITQSLGGGTENEVFATQIGIIKDRSMAEKLISKLDLSESPEFKRDPGFLITASKFLISEIRSLLDPGWMDVPDPNQEREELITEVQERVSARRDAQSRLIIVGFQAGKPDLAKELLTNLTDIYLAQNLEKRRRVQREASAWLDGEIEKAEEKVIKSLAELVSFSSKHGMVAMDEGANHILTFFQKAAEALVKTKEQRITLEAFQKDERANISAVVAGVKSPDVEQLHNKLSLLEAEHAQMTEIYSESYPKVVLLRKQIKFLRDRIQEVQSQAVGSIVETARQQESVSEDVFEKAKQLAMDNKSLGIQFAVLKREAETNEAIYKTLLTKSKELQLSTEIIGNNILTVVHPTFPVKPIKPRKGLYLAIGAMLGVILGVGAAFLRERLDTSVYDSRDLEKLRITNLGMIPNYAHIKKVEGPKSDEDTKLPAELIAASDPTSALADAFSIVRTSLLLTTSYSDIRTLLFTSSVPGEGKSFNCVSLSSVIAAYGKRVLILEADLRKPRLSKLFEKKSDDPGLSTLLTFSNINIEKCIKELPTPNLFFMGAGPRPKDPARLLDSERMSELIHELRDMFDFVMIDAPPVTGLPDSRILSTAVDGIVFVIRQGHASLDVIRSATANLGRTRRNIILGAIFNNVGVSSSRYSAYGSYGGYGYSHYYKYGYSSYYRAKDDKKIAKA